jgi:hypothetical protein
VSTELDKSKPAAVTAYRSRIKEVGKGSLPGPAARRRQAMCSDKLYVLSFVEMRRHANDARGEWRLRDSDKKDSEADFQQELQELEQRGDGKAKEQRASKRATRTENRQEGKRRRRTKDEWQRCAIRGHFRFTSHTLGHPRSKTEHTKREEHSLLLGTVYSDVQIA